MNLGKNEGYFEEYLEECVRRHGSERIGEWVIGEEKRAGSGKQHKKEYRILSEALISPPSSFKAGWLSPTRVLI